MSASALQTIRKTIVVDSPLDEAFETFTAGMSAWWPLRTHSVGEERAESVEVEPHAGGRVVEQIAGGERSVWAHVLAWEPPHRLVYSWYPGRSPDDATEVEVRFEADGDRTRIELEHRGWERLRDRPEVTRPSHRTYASGWDTVLGHYREATGKS
jgi:uncharacterized protein YndB with AHSA1/START domain